jgi:rRNA biogenesis protein RRP5
VDISSTPTRIQASIRQTALPASRPPPPPQPAVDISKVDIGSTVEGKITALHKENVVLELEPTKCRGMVSYATLSRRRGVSVDELRASLALGQVLSDLIVVSKNAEKGIVIVGPKREAPVPGSISAALSVDSLEEGQVVLARVDKTTRQGIQVKVSRYITARVPWTEISDDYNEATPNKGDVVKCKVIYLDKEQNQVDVSLRRSRLRDGSSKDKPKDPVVDDVTQVKPGQKIRGFVKNIGDAGLFVSLGRTLTARVQIKVRHTVDFAQSISMMMTVGCRNCLTSL